MKNPQIKGEKRGNECKGEEVIINVQGRDGLWISWLSGIKLLIIRSKFLYGAKNVDFYITRRNISAVQI